MAHADATGAAPVFRLLDQSGAATVPLVGVWTILPGEQAASFNPQSATSTEFPCWQANFSADMARAVDELALARRNLEAARVELVRAGQQLHASIAAIEQQDITNLSFAAASSHPAERELRRMLAQLDHRKASVNFGMTDMFGVEWSQATTEVKTFLAQVQRHIAAYAWVETRIEGRLVAQTLVDWTGAFRTVWSLQLQSDRTALHQQTLALALQSRSRLVETLGVVMRGAAHLSKIAVLASTPGGAVLALPAVWRFVKLVLG